MHPNDLPDDCLILIFEYFGYLEELVTLSRVCSKWRRIVSYRLERTKYLISEYRKRAKDRQCLKAKSLAVNPRMIYTKNCEPLLQLQLNQLLPNLRVLELCYKVPLESCRYVTESIRGLFYPTYYEILYQKEREDSHIKAFANFFPNLEMIVLFGKMDRYFKESPQGKNLRQIYIDDTTFNATAQFADNLPNLKRLHIDSFYQTSQRYEGPVFTSLQILEICQASTDTFFGFQNIDACPVLQSAYIYAIGRKFNTDLKINKNLRDLVIVNSIDNYNNWSKCLSFEDLQDLLSNFPNLEHFALRGNDLITDIDIKILLETESKLKILDFRGSKHITSKAAHYAHQYRFRTGRSLDFYYDYPGGKEPIDWPPIDDVFSQIVRGFDFMRNCFFRTFESLPYLMDPEDSPY